MIIHEFRPRLISDLVPQKEGVIFLRGDYNVPKNDSGEITDYLRIREGADDVRKARNLGFKVVTATHRSDTKFDTKAEADALSKDIGDNVIYYPGQITEELGNLIKSVPSGTVIMLNDLRRLSNGEKDGSSKEGIAFAQALFENIKAQAYAFTGFGNAHGHEQASMLPLMQLFRGAGLPVVSGSLVVDEVTRAAKFAEGIGDDGFIIVGGGGPGKADKKLKYLAKLAPYAEKILVGGGLASLVCQANGSITNGSYTAEALEKATKVLGKIKEADLAKFVFPSDWSVERKENHLEYLDIGKYTREMFSNLLGEAQSAFLNLVMGVCENPLFRAGTDAIIKATISQIKAGKNFLVGGGDSAGAVEDYIKRNGIPAELAEKVRQQISTGGGSLYALLESFLKGKPLPVLAAIDSK